MNGILRGAHEKNGVLKKLEIFIFEGDYGIFLLKSYGKGEGIA